VRGTAADGTPETLTVRPVRLPGVKDTVPPELSKLGLSRGMAEIGPKLVASP
jgi:hypothetical protein